MMSGLIIEKVLPGSIAEEMEIVPGDRLTAINGHPLRDIIDYNYFSVEEELTLEIVKGDGVLWDVEIERGEDEPLGLIFQAPVPFKCGNKCIFCFVHQLPAGLRSPLYVKDEDYRLSFLYGNYVTLANIGREEMARIIEQRLSPLYVSVHATDAPLRERLLGKKGIIPIMEIMEELAASRITMHTQVVLCPGINDGEILEKTVADLASLHPWVASLAIVPVGLTRHRRGLPPLQPVTKEYALPFIARWEQRSGDLRLQWGEPFLFLADEFYLKAGKPFPPLESYGDLPQLENGVGMAPLFLAEAATVLEQAEPLKPFRVTVATGKSPYRFLADFLKGLSRKTGVDLCPVAINNRLFGASVTVTGLVSGADITFALKGRDLGAALLIPDVMLKEGEGLFLDEMTVDELEDSLGVRVIAVEASPQGIHKAIRQLSASLLEEP
jgi:putative radical SAM enzyme (TIGR03279 family)